MEPRIASAAICAVRGGICLAGHFSGGRLLRSQVPTGRFGSVRGLAILCVVCVVAGRPPKLPVRLSGREFERLRGGIVPKKF